MSCTCEISSVNRLKNHRVCRVIREFIGVLQAYVFAKCARSRGQRAPQCVLTWRTPHRYTCSGGAQVCSHARPTSIEHCCGRCPCESSGPWWPRHLFTTERTVADCRVHSWPPVAEHGRPSKCDFRQCFAERRCVRRCVFVKDVLVRRCKTLKIYM